jgi:hypothetical protein
MFTISEIDQDETRMIESLFDEASQEEMERLYIEDLEAFYEYPTDEELEDMAQSYDRQIQR